MTSTLVSLTLMLAVLLPAHHNPHYGYACWDEPNASQPGGFERMGGPTVHMPATATHISFTYPNCEA